MAMLKIRLLMSLLCGWVVIYLFFIYKQLRFSDQLMSRPPNALHSGAQAHQYSHESPWRLQHRILTFSHPPGCPTLNPDIVLYNRIFKTGSTSTTSWLDTVHSTMNFTLELATTEDWYRGKPHVYPGIIARHAKKGLSHPNTTRYVFAAHFYFRYRLNVPYSYTYINQVRHPVQRVISHYYYIHRSKTRPRHRMRRLRRSGHLHESLEACLRHQHKGCEHNVMTRFFCGKHSYCSNGSARALRKAKTHISHHYVAVGLLQHFDVYLKILHKMLPTFIPLTSRVMLKEKVNRLYTMSEVSNGTIETISKLNSADLKLYEFIKQRFWRQAKACGVN